MMINPNKKRHEGFFIVFEGLDGSGTSTQVALLQKRLLSMQLEVEVTEEPSGGPIGMLIRQAIRGRIKLDMHTLALAFAADRVDHLYNEQNGVLKALKEKRIVISDRYVLSSLAYQTLEIDDLDWLKEINSKIIKPELTIFIDTPVEECAKRIAGRSSHYELFHSVEKLNRVRENYLKAMSPVSDPASSRSNLPRRQTGRDRYGETKIFDGSKPIDKLHEEVFRYVLKLLKEKKYLALFGKQSGIPPA